MVAKFDTKPSLSDEKELVFLLVPMPRKFALDIDWFELLAVHRRDQPWAAQLIEWGELLVEIDFFGHEIASFTINLQHYSE
jgi:hypothetical protein